MTFLVARASQPATVELAALTVTNRISLQGWEPPPPSPGRRRELGSSEGANAQRPETFIFPYDGFSVVLQDKEPQTGLCSTFLAA